MRRALVIFWILGLCCKLFGCTDFLIPTAGGHWINGRSLEFATKMPTHVVLIPKGEMVQSIAPKNLPGLKWISKYAYLGVACVTEDNVIDGMNEEGLSIGGLWLPTSVYQSVPQNQSSRAVAIELFGKWLLGNFATVAEVKEGLSKILVWEGNPLPGVDIPPLHLSIHDATGASLVIEFIGGEQKVYDNPVQVLTNYPEFDWQMTNLQNYTQLNSLDAKSLVYNGQNFTLKGQGSGMLGVPGNWMPVSRFVRIFYFKYFADMPMTISQGVNLAFHLLNTVDIPFGAVVERTSSNENVDFTQWVVVKDLTNRVVYFRTYDNQNIYQLSLNDLNLKPGVRYPALPINRRASYPSLGTLSF